MSDAIMDATTGNECPQDGGSTASHTRRSALKLFFCVAASSVSRARGQEQTTHAGEISAGTVSLKVNPYEHVDWSRVGHYKLNLHTHTTQSDGQLTPAQVMDEYHSRGYHGLAITDHNRNTWPWTAFGRDPAAMKMLAISANELSRHHHTLSLFANYETPETDLDAALAGVAKAGGMAVLCHPAMHWVPEYNQASGLRVPLSPPLRRLAQGDFTLETWFRTTNAGRNILLGNYSTSHSGALNLELHTENRVRIFVQPANGGKTIDINISGETMGINTWDGQWRHLAGVRCDGAISLYLDGRLVGRETDAAGPFELQGDALFLGRDSRTGDTTLKGDLCQVRLWRRGLSQQELTSLVSGNPVSTEGLLAQYASPTTTGKPFADTSGHPEGPFDAEVAGHVCPQSIDETPGVLRSTQIGALHFAPAGFPEHVPDDTVARYLGLFKRHPHLAAIEVLNRTRPDREIPLDRQLWDGLLSASMPDRPIWGVAVDDMHAMRHLGGDWIVALAPQLTEQSARESLTTGCYYFASTRLHAPAVADVKKTPRIERITHDPATGHIAITATVEGTPVPDSAYAWISNGRLVHTGPTLAYRRTSGIGTYARAEIAGDGGTIFTNPFGLLH